MAGHGHAQHDDTPIDPTAKYEKRDLHVKPLAMFAMWFVIVMIGIFFLVWWTFRAADNMAVSTDLPRTGVAQVPVVPPDPKLQYTPLVHPNSDWKDMDIMRKEQLAIRDGYGPTTQPGTVHVPVARAMELVIQNPALLTPTGVTAPTTRPGATTQSSSSTLNRPADLTATRPAGQTPDPH